MIDHVFLEVNYCIFGLLTFFHISLAYQLKEEQSVYGSDEEEEVYDAYEGESDEDLTDAGSQILDEVYTSSYFL